MADILLNTSQRQYLSSVTSHEIQRPTEIAVDTWHMLKLACKLSITYAELSALADAAWDEGIHLIDTLRKLENRAMNDGVVGGRSGGALRNRPGFSKPNQCLPSHGRPERNCDPHHPDLFSERR